jgi:enoyl-CoA hydratase/carnithine racemase
MSDVFFTERRGHVIAGFMNRPRVHNAMDSALREQLLDFWDEVRDDPEIRVAIIAGAPGTSFSSGRDLKETADAYSADKAGADWELGHRTGYPVDTPTGKPVIAAIDRYCLGAGLKVAAECDLRIAATTAVFASPQAKVGRATESPLYLRKAGLPAAVSLDMVFTGKRLSADEALNWGFVSRVVEAERLLDEAWEMAATIAEMSPTVVSGLKKGIDAELAEMPTSIGSPLWKSLTAMYGDTEDARRGAAAFVRKNDTVYGSRT